MKRLSGVFLYSVVGGICIGLGSTVFLRLKDAFPGGNVVGALLFTIGLFAICTRGYLLFTGKACYIFDNPPSYVLDVCVIWLGNFVGCILLAWLQSMTPLFGPKGINAIAAQVVAGKMEASYLGLFILGILCSIFIYIAVNGYANNPHELGKYLCLFLGVAVFILSGTEHCVADMYYWCTSGVLFEAPVESILRICVVSLGNFVGGLSFRLAEKAKAWLDRPSISAPS